MSDQYMDHYELNISSIIKIQSIVRQIIAKNLTNINNFKDLLVENNIIELFIDEWNNKKLPEFQKLAYGKDFKEIFKNEKTQEKTKQLSFWLYIILEYLICKKIPKLQVDKREKRDYIYDTTPIEAKITLSSGNSWTGNGTKKTPWHLLIKINMGDDGVIKGCFCMLANIVECSINWTEPKKSKKGEPVNFSSLTFPNKCFNKLIIVNGSIFKSKKDLPVSRMKEYAKKYNIKVPSKSNREEVLNKIKSQLQNLDKNAKDEWNELFNNINPEDKIKYVY